MNKEEAKEKAERKVYVSMNRGDIEDECIRNGLKLSKDRGVMERRLIKFYTEEWTK